MAIPLVTTTITVVGVRPLPAVDPDAEGFDAPSPSADVLVEGLNACISGPTVSNVGDAEREIWKLRCDPTDLHLSDEVLDEGTGVVYRVHSVAQSEVPANMLFLNHTMADLVRDEGLPAR